MAKIIVVGRFTEQDKQKIVNVIKRQRPQSVVQTAGTTTRRAEYQQGNKR